MKRRFLLLLVGSGVSLGGAMLLYALVAYLYWSPTVANVMVLALVLWGSYQVNRRIVWKPGPRPVVWTSYGPNRRIVWRQKPQHSRQMHRFVMSRIATSSLSALVYELLFRQVGTHYLIAYAAGVAVGMTMNFVVSDKWVFAKTDRTRSVMLTWKTALKALFLVACIVAGLWVAASDAFLPVVFTTLAMIAIAAVCLTLIAGLYVHRDESSWQPAVAYAPEDVTMNERIGLIMPARHEGKHYGFTILNAAFTQRDHPFYRIFAVVNDNDPDTTRVALLAADVINAVELREVSFAQLESAFEERWTLEGRRTGALTDEEMERIHAYSASDALVQPVVFPLGGQQPSKPKQLNYVFQLYENAGFTTFTILDAESMAQPGLFCYVDSVFHDNPSASVVQGAVQLMDPPLGRGWLRRFIGAWRRWFSWHNLLEYHRWFSGQMAFQSDNQFVPLGGNTLFVRTEVLSKTGGWPLSLTEDCALGVKISAHLGGEVVTFYKPQLATREETPPTLRDLVKQRTRWNQGFLESFVAGLWQEMPTLRQRFLAFWILSHPFFQAASTILLPIAVSLMVTGILKSPVPLVLVMFLPIMLSLLMVSLQIEQLYDFGRTYQRRIPFVAYVILVVTQPVYQWMLSWAAFRAVMRHFSGQTSWQSPARSGDLIASVALKEVS